MHSAATSSAPTIGRKRRVDDDEDDEVEQNASLARKRRVAPGMERQLSDMGELIPAAKEADPSVKEVTQGVKQVELEEKAKIAGFPPAKELREAKEAAVARLRREEEEDAACGLVRGLSRFGNGQV